MKRISFVLQKMASHAAPLAAVAYILGALGNINAQSFEMKVKIPALNCTFDAISWSFGTQVTQAPGRDQVPLMGPFTLLKDPEDGCGAQLFLRTLPSPGQMVPAMTITETVGGGAPLITIQLKNVRVGQYALVGNSPTTCTPQPPGSPAVCTGGSLAESITISYEAISITKFGGPPLCWNATTNTATCI